MGLPGAFRKHPRPGDGEAIGLDAEILDQADVFLVAMIMFVGAVAIAAVADLARRVGERVPDRRAAAVFVDRALDLVGRCGGAPDKILRETARARARSAACLALSAASAGGAARPSAESPASFAKCRRENLENIDFLPSGLRIDLVGGNPVDLEGDRRRGFVASTNPTPLKFFEPIARLTIMYIGIVEAGRDLDVGDRLAVDEIGDAVVLPQRAVVVEAVGAPAPGNRSRRNGPGRWPECANASSSRGRRAAARGLPARRSRAASRRHRRASRTPAIRRSRPGSWRGFRSSRISARTTPCVVRMPEMYSLSNSTALSSGGVRLATIERMPSLDLEGIEPERRRAACRA